MERDGERKAIIDLIRGYGQFWPREDGTLPTDDEIWEDYLRSVRESDARRAREPKEHVYPEKSSDDLFEAYKRKIETESARVHADLAQTAYERRLQPLSRFGGQRKKNTDPRRKRSSSKASRNKRKRSSRSRTAKRKRSSRKRSR